MELTKPITLEQLAKSGIGERFDHSLAEVLDNALDPNRDQKKVRHVALVLSFHPQESDEGRPRAAMMEAEVKVKLVPLKPLKMQTHFGRVSTTGEPVALLIDPQQHEMFATDKLDGSIVPIGSKAASE